MATEPVNPKIAPFPASKIAPLLRVLAESDETDPEESRIRAAERVASNLAAQQRPRDH